MCGFTGILNLRGRGEIDEALLNRMNESQHHRGPDAGGLYRAPGVGLGHRRLSIIDLSTGQQPLFNEDHSVVVVYNGEIYNFQELSKELEALGHRFRTRCDTEVVVHAWEEWGADCLSRFRGMFAFALWDENRETLFLARDRLGIKPLHYAVLPDQSLIFGSELKSLLVHPGLPRDIDPQAVEDFFAFGYIPDPRCIFKQVRKLAPGYFLEIRRGEAFPEPKRYWEPSFPEQAPASEAEVCEELRARMQEAVSIRLIADVPLGAFLSGGVDSSGVVATMAGCLQDPVDTCSISFGRSEYDESRYAAEISERYGTRHHTRQVDPDDFDLVDRLIDVYDEPYADSSAMPTYRVCQIARENVTVALSGDGGDEVFAGYRRYRWYHYEELVRQRLSQSIRGPLFNTLGSLYPKLDWAPKPLRAKATLQALGRDSAEGYFHSISILPSLPRMRLYSQEYRRSLQGYRAESLIQELMDQAPSEHHLSKAQYVDMKTYLPGDILTKVDRASMAHSLEVRVPLLDHKFVEWAGGLPPDWKLRGREGKYIFKKALEPLVPEGILYRPKQGFAVPLSDWFRNELSSRVRGMIQNGALAETGYFDMAEVSRLVKQHQSGLREHGPTIWALLMFDGFLRRQFDLDVQQATADRSYEGVAKQQAAQ